MGRGRGFFELGEEEMARVAGEKRERLRRELKMDKVCGSSLGWTPASSLELPSSFGDLD